MIFQWLDYEVQTALSGIHWFKNEVLMVLNGILVIGIEN